MKQIGPGNTGNDTTVQIVAARKKARRRRWKRVLLVLLAFFGAFIGLRCAVPASFRATKEPRAGTAVGGHVAIVYSKHYQIDMGGAERLHSFDIRKYAKIYLELNTQGFIRPEDVFVPQPVSREQVLLVHTPEFIESLGDSSKVARYLEVPIVGVAPAGLVDAGILNAFRYATGGTIEAGRQALRHGIAVNLGGGYHHAKPAKGEGFCIYNDMAIAIRALQKEGLIRRAMVVDLDVHQGNGTAVIFAGDSSVYTFDMHEEDIYPIPKEKCTQDIGLPRGTNDAYYLAKLRQHLPAAIDKAQPDIIFFQGGCDVLEGDPLARLRLSAEGIVERDAFVIDQCVRRRIPVAMVLGGGYSGKAWEVQFASVKRTIQTYGLPSPAHAPRSRTAKESLYVK